MFSPRPAPRATVTQLPVTLVHASRRNQGVRTLRKQVTRYDDECEKTVLQTWRAPWPNLSGTSRPVSRILSDGDHPSEARRCRWAPATYPETSREQRSDGFRGQRTGLLGLAPGGVYRAAPVTRRTGGLLHHRFTLTRQCRAVCSLWHFPAGHPGWALPTTLLCGVRTFLSLVSQAAITRPAHPGDDSTSAGLPEPTPHPGGHTESPGRLATPGLDAGHLTAAGPQSPESAVRTRMRSHSTHRSTSFSGALR